MADKISKFKQALRAQRSQPAETSAFENEIEKYKHTKQPAKASSPKKNIPKSADSHSSTANTTKSIKNIERKTSANSKSVNGGNKNIKDNKTTSLRLSTHARSSQLIQRKDQPSKRDDKKNVLNKDKPGEIASSGNKKIKKSSRPAESQDRTIHSETPSPNISKDKDEPLNFFKKIVTSIHKHILSAESQPPSPLVERLVLQTGLSSHVMNDVMEEAKREAESMEITERLSQEVKQLVGTVGEICESEAASWGVSHTPRVEKTRVRPLSLFDNNYDDNETRSNDQPSSPPFHIRTLRLDASPETGSYFSRRSSLDLYEDHPLSTRKRPRQSSKSPRINKKLVITTRHSPSPSAHPLPYPPSPLMHISPSSLARHTPSPPMEFESPPLSLDLFHSQPAPDFFGFSRSQESFSDMQGRKLFRADFI